MKVDRDSLFDTPAPVVPKAKTGINRDALFAPSAGDQVVSEMGVGDRLLAGAGHGLERTFGLARRGTAALTDAVFDNPVGEAIDNAGQAIGLPSMKQEQGAVDAALAANKAEGEPLLKTASGKAGNIGGVIAGTIPTVLIPGANTYRGAATIGAGTGALLSEGQGLAERGKDALIGLVAGAAGKGVGDTLAAGARAAKTKLGQLLATETARLQPVKEAVTAARGAGFVVPPTTTNPTMVNRVLEGAAGKLSTAQSASMKNQGVTNALIKKGLGVADDAPLTADTLAVIRNNAGKAYDNVAKFGKFTPDNQYSADIAAIAGPLNTFAKDFPELANREAESIVQALSKPEFDSASAVEALKRFRFDGNANKASMDPAKKEVGRIQLKAADALENMMERNLSKFVGGADMLKNLKQARQAIAKTYTVEKALNSQTGNVNAQRLAGELKKGKPLSGEIRQVAEFASNFPKAAQEVKDSMPGLSPLDFAGAGGISAAAGNPSLLALIGARPAVRATLLSQPYQNLMTGPSPSNNRITNALLDLLQNQKIRETAPGAAAALVTGQ